MLLSIVSSGHHLIGALESRIMRLNVTETWASLMSLRPYLIIVSKASDQHNPFKKSGFQHTKAFND